ncbi:MAG: FixH family protein [Campylobacterota bacterium]
MSQKRTNFWPESVAAILIAAALLLVWTVYKTSSMPVQEENIFMSTYQDVDMNAEDFVRQNNLFFDRFDIKLSSEYTQKEYDEEFYKKRGMFKRVIDPDEPIVLQVSDTQNNAVSVDDITVIVSRPTTRVSDTEIALVRQNTGEYVLQDVTFDSSGRWQLVVKVQKGEYVGFKNIEIYVE